MAKKKRKPGGKAPKGRGRPKSSQGDAPALPPWAMIEAMMGDMLGVGPGAAGEDTPEGRAHQILLRAHQAGTERAATDLARKALDAWPDCADAYVLLAEHARTAREAADLYAAGVEAGARTLGPEAFEEAVGHFWGLLETRPYMRARYGLAQSLWSTGRREEAINHARELLRLNPGDNQGVRYALAAWLLELGRDEELGRLLQEYPEEGSATWAYLTALHAFRQEGDTPRSRKLLAAAKKVNKFVPEYLLGEKMLPSQRPATVGFGDRDEAIDSAAGLLPGWKATPGAVAWLRGAGKRSRARKPAKATVGPVPEVKERLRALPQKAGEVWQADVRRLPVWLTVGKARVRPWLLLVTNRTEDLVLGQDILEEPPTPEQVWDKLAQTMEAPSVETPHRPAELQVLKANHWEVLGPHLDEVGVACTPVEELDHLDYVVGQLVEHLCGPRALKGLLDMPGLGPEQVGRFFEAAADFYRRAPWRTMAGEETIKVECDRFESGPWYAVVFGQMGMTFGLALYEDLEALRRMRSGRLSDEENARLTVALSVTYGDETEIPVADLDAAERYGWEVADPDAYPAPIRKERGMVMRLPLSWELTLLEACLRALPDFAERHDHTDPAPEDVTVPTFAGDLRLTLSWVLD